MKGQIEGKWVGVAYNSQSVHESDNTNVWELNGTFPSSTDIN